MKKYLRFLSIVLPLCLLHVSRAQVVGPAGQLQSVSSGARAPSSTSEFVVPLWKGDFLVSFYPFRDSRQEPNVFVWNKDGLQLLKTSVWPLDAVRVILTDVSAAHSAKEIVVSGSARDRFGTVAYFIAKVDLSGRILSLIQTNPFIPSHVCVAEDGAVWTFGRPNGSDINPSNNPDDRIGLLRQYRFEAGLVKRYFTIADFGGSRDPWATKPQAAVFLRCAAGKVGLWSGGTREWVELETLTGDIRKWHWDNLQGLDVSNVVLTDAGMVFGSLVDLSDNIYKTLGVFRLDRDNAKRTAIWSATTNDGTNPDAPITKLLGTDGTNLVHLRKHTRTMFFSRPQ